MSGLKKTTILLFTAIVLLPGCSMFNHNNKNTSQNVPLVSSEQRKTTLLNKLDKKYNNPNAHYELGKIYLQDGLWSKAEMEFNTAIGYNPSLWKAEAAKVKTIIQAGNASRAALSAENAMNRAGVSAEASLLLGKAFQRELLDDYALSCYQQSLRLAPNSAGLNKQIAYYYLSKNDKVRAEEYLRRSFQLDPYQAEVAGELGRMGVVVKIPPKQPNILERSVDTVKGWFKKK